MTTFPSSGRANEPAYYIFVDESGDDSIKSIDDCYPILVIAMIVVEAEYYRHVLGPRFISMKKRYFGNDHVILRERDIRRGVGPFASKEFLPKKVEFMNEIGKKIDRSEIMIISSVIDKRFFCEGVTINENIYNLAVKFCLERVRMELMRRDGAIQNTVMVAESRGRRPDRRLAKAIKRCCAGENLAGPLHRLGARFEKKRRNLIGLQLADLVARPIGCGILHPNQNNRALMIIERKMRRSPSGLIDGWGRKCFPTITSNARMAV